MRPFESRGAAVARQTSADLKASSQGGCRQSTACTTAFGATSTRYGPCSNRRASRALYRTPIATAFATHFGALPQARQSRKSLGRASRVSESPSTAHGGAAERGERCLGQWLPAQAEAASEVLFVGLSLGGSLAQIAALRAALELPSQVRPDRQQGVNSDTTTLGHPAGPQAARLGDGLTAVGRRSNCAPLPVYAGQPRGLAGVARAVEALSFYACQFLLLLCTGDGVALRGPVAEGSRVVGPRRRRQVCGKATPRRRPRLHLVALHPRHLVAGLW